MKTNEAYNMAKDMYKEAGIDTEAALKALGRASLSLHCWQGDDVSGFETPDSSLSGGGIQVTGNYPGKAGSIDELKQDLDTVYSLIPGSHRLNLHAIYGDFKGKKVDRDQIEPAHFETWMNWAEEKDIKLDFNGTFFSHPMADSGYTLSDRDQKVRDFWIEHARRARKITSWFGEQQGSPSVHNLWIPDGDKDYPANRFAVRSRLKDSLDKIYDLELPGSQIRDAVETKLFGIGSEAFVAGSHEFYMGYAFSRNKMLCLDMGHFHPTELIADKISSVFQFQDELLLHISRPMRWDSDHVVLLNDDTRFLAEEIVRSGALEKTWMGLDFFDASINRIGAWTTGARAFQKALLMALLQPADQLEALENEGNRYGRMALAEKCKTLPWGLVWDQFCETQNVPVEQDIMKEVLAYETKTLSARGAR